MTSALEKTRQEQRGQDEEKWKQSAPAARDVDQTTVDNLVSAVTGARHRFVRHGEPARQA
jgi:hypothetical protein